MQESMTGNIAIIFGVIALAVTLYREVCKIMEKRQKMRKLMELEKITRIHESDNLDYE